MNGSEIKFEGNTIVPENAAQKSVQHAAIYKEIRSWGVSLLLLGVIHLIASGFLSASWGVFIMIVGAASFYFRSSAMMVVFAVTLAWAAINNALAGGAGWILFSVVQVVMTVRVFMKFFQFRKGELNLENGHPEEVGLTPARSAKFFPWLGFSFGLFSFVGFVALFATMVILGAVIPNYSTPIIFNTIIEIIITIGVLGLAFGLASILCKYLKKVFSILGLVFSGLTLVIVLIFSLLG